MLLGYVLVCYLGGKSFLKSMIMVCTGLFLGTVGLDALSGAREIYLWITRSSGRGWTCSHVHGDVWYRRSVYDDGETSGAAGHRKTQRATANQTRLEGFQRAMARGP